MRYEPRATTMNYTTDHTMDCKTELPTTPPGLKPSSICSRAFFAGLKKPAPRTKVRGYTMSIWLWDLSCPTAASRTLLWLLSG